MKCPKCKKDDNVRKISVVLDEGTTTSQTLGFNVPINNHKKHQNDAFSVSTFSTTSQSVLVSRLQTPSKPRQKWKHFSLLIYSIYFLITSLFVNKGFPSISKFEFVLAYFFLTLPILITKLLSQFFPSKILVLIWNRFRTIIYVVYYFLLVTLDASAFAVFTIDEDILGFCLVAFVISFPIFVLVAFIVQLFVPISEEIVDWQKSVNNYRRSFYCFRDDICFNEQLNESPEQFKSKLFK